jgi:hypothetical protein
VFVDDKTLSQYSNEEGPPEEFFNHLQSNQNIIRGSTLLNRTQENPSTSLLLQSSLPPLPPSAAELLQNGLNASQRVQHVLEPVGSVGQDCSLSVQHALEPVGSVGQDCSLSVQHALEPVGSVGQDCSLSVQHALEPVGSVGQGQCVEYVPENPWYETEGDELEEEVMYIIS